MIVEEAPPAVFFAQPKHSRARSFLRRVEHPLLDTLTRPGSACVTTLGAVPKVEPTTFAIGLRCVRCGATYPLAPLFEGCQRVRRPSSARG